MAKQVDKNKKERPKLPPIKCKGCGVLFTPRTRREKFHSANCREDYYDRTYYHNESTTKTCPNCGNNFETTKPGRQEYCSCECRQEARDKRRQGIITENQQERKLFYTDRYRQLAIDGFKCSACGRKVHGGITLDVVEIEGKLTTRCNECIEGMKGAQENVLDKE